MPVQYSQTYNLPPLRGAVVTHGTGGTTPGIATPANFRQTSASDTTMDLAWDAVPNATGYQVQLNGGTIYTTSTATTYQIASLVRNMEGTATVKALGANGTSSALSAAIKVQTTVYILMVKRGNSIPLANQASLEAGETPETGTTSIQAAQGAKGNVGRHSAIDQAADLLNAQKAPFFQFDSVVLGYGGMTAAWYERNHLFDSNNNPIAYAGFTLSGYKRAYEYLDFIANDPVYPDRPTDPTDPAGILATHIRIFTQLKAQASIPVYTIETDGLNRDNYPEFVNFKVFLAQFRQLAYASNAFDQITNYASQPVGQDAAPIGTVDAPTNALFYDRAGHPRIVAQGQMGLEDSRGLARREGFVLTQGNGTRPVARPAATIAITPTSGVASVTRTATLTTNGTFTAPQLFRISPQGLTYAPTLIGSGTSVNFTASDSGSYYFGGTASGATVSSYPNAIATVTNASNPLVTKQLAFGYRQWFGPQAPDGSMAKNGGDTTAYSAHACASDRLLAARIDETILSFTAVRPATAAHGYNLGVASAAPPRGGGGNVAPFGYRLSPDYIEILNGSDTAAFSKAWDVASGLLTMEFQAGFLVYKQGGTVLASFAAFAVDYYMNVCAKGNSAVIPPITVASRGLADNPMTPSWVGRQSAVGYFFEKNGTWYQGGPNNDEMYTQTPGDTLRGYAENVSGYTLECAVDSNTRADLLLDNQPVGTVDGSALPAGPQPTRDFGPLSGGHFIGARKTANTGNFFISFTSGTGAA